MATVVLIHGGLHEDMDAERFWVRPGIVGGLRERGLDVLAPDRRPPHRRGRRRSTSAAHVAVRPIVLVGGSNGCSVAVRLVLAQAHSVVGLVLAWPATAGDPSLDAALRARLGGDELLTGKTLRGVSDAELAGLGLPVTVVPSEPPNRVHQRHTVDALLRLLPSATELPGSVEPPHPTFQPDGFVAEILDWVNRRPPWGR